MINARVMKNGWRAIALFLVCLLLDSPHTALAKKPACTHAQLEIRQIALDSPGMSKTNAFFAILNTGKRACRLTAEFVKVSEKPISVPLPDDAPVHHLLPPLRGRRFAGAEKVIGFNISNNGASGPSRHIHSLYFELADGKTFQAAYEGYDTSPFESRTKVIRLSVWEALHVDQCVVAKDKSLSIEDNPEIDTKTLLFCG